MSAVALPELAPRAYEVLKEVGDGSFGTVWLADWHSPLTLPPGTEPPGPSSRPEYAGKQLVAIKRMKKAFDGGWAECMKLKELKSLRTIPMHPNIIPLYDAFLQPTSRELYFVFECMEGNLYQLTKSRRGRPLAPGLVANIFRQILHGVDHVHRSGFFHRDLKPENLLITTTGLANWPHFLPGAPIECDILCHLKLADFGLAREITSKPPYTEYVSTRWYRAPEVLLRSRDYSVPVDAWAIGTIMAEVVTLKPLFPGRNEVEQVLSICQILGDPCTDYGWDDSMPHGGGVWERGAKLARAVGFAFPQIPPIPFASLFDPRIAPRQLIECIAGLLRYEPMERLTVTHCLTHPYLREVAALMPPTAVETRAGPVRPVLSPQPVAPSSTALAYVSPPSTEEAPPPSHSHGTPVHGFARSDHDALGRSVNGHREHSYAVPVIGPGHESTSSSHRQSIPHSVSSNGSYHSQYSSPVAGPSGLVRRQRVQTAASDYYAGSILEGISPVREETYATFVDSEPLPFGRRTMPSAGLKRTPSDRSGHREPTVAPAPAPMPPTPPMDPKMAKKAAKEAEKLRREQMQKAARERARAVMSKQRQLGAAADPLNRDAYRPAPVDKGKTRATPGRFVTPSSSLPQIAEDRQAPYRTATRYKARRRDDDDDAATVSSNETRNDDPYGRRALSTASTAESGQSGHLSQSNSVPALSNHYLDPALAGARAPGSSGSSVDLHLAATFRGLSAADAQSHISLPSIYSFDAYGTPDRVPSARPPTHSSDPARFALNSQPPRE